MRTGFLEPQGITQQTSDGGLIGERFDKRFNLQLGPERIVNGSFNDGSTAWTTSVAGASTITFNVGSVHFSCTGADVCSLIQAAGMEAGKTYDVAFNVLVGSSGQLKIGPVGTAGEISFVATISSKRFRTYAFSTASFVVSRVVAQAAEADITGITVKEIYGNHVTQSSGAVKPALTILGSVVSDFFDGIDDGYSSQVFAAATFGTPMDIFLALNRISTANMVCCSNGPGSLDFIGAMQAANVSNVTSGTGAAWSCFVDGVQVGGVGTATRDALNTAVGSGTWKIIELRDLGMSTWTQFSVGLWPSYMLGGDFGGLILCESQPALRNNLRSWLGGKVGLSL